MASNGIPQRSLGSIDPADKLSSVHEAPTITETVEAAAEFARYALGCTTAAVLLGKRADQLELAAATEPSDELIRLATADHGPLADAFHSPTPVIINDLGYERRWPDWPPADGAHLGSLLLLRLQVGQRPGGLLLAGHTDPKGFDTDDAAIAHIVARHASIAVANAQQQATLAEAVDARKLVGQAMGILMERYTIDADQAFAVLRRYSQDTNTKLHTIARQLIDTRKLPDQPS